MTLSCRSPVLLLLLLKLVWLSPLANAQVTQLPDQQLYRGADYSFSLILTRSDSSLASLATLYFSQNGGALKSSAQPALSRTGRALTLAWSAAQTGDMSDGKFWLEIKAGTSVRFAAWVIAGKTPSIVTRPGTLTVISPITEYQNAPPDKPYPLSNVAPNGHRINHGKATNLVTGTFFREVTTPSGITWEEDKIWKIVIVDENNVDVIGPASETFSGYVVLKPTSISNQ